MPDDLFKTLGAGFSQVGKRIRSGADELKKAAGIGVGNIALALDRYEFRPGDSVTGRVTLGLAEPIEAKRIVVSLTGTADRVSYEKDASGRRRQSRHSETLCQVERELDGARTYRNESYTFSLMIPTEAGPASSRPDDGVLGDVARVINAVANASLLPTSWRVVAWLDIPWKRNIKTHVDIQVRTR